MSALLPPLADPPDREAIGFGDRALRYEELAGAAAAVATAVGGARRVAVFNGPHPETGEALEVVDHAPEGAPPVDLPPEPDVFAPDYAPEEIAQIAQKLREAAGLPKTPTGVVANNGGGLVDKVKDAVT